MTVVLNPFPAPPTLRVPIPAAPGDHVVSTRFGDLLRDLHPQTGETAFLEDSVVPASDDRVRASADADVFNEHGFFQGARVDAAVTPPVSVEPRAARVAPPSVGTETGVQDGLQALAPTEGFFALVDAEAQGFGQADIPVVGRVGLSAKAVPAFVSAAAHETEERGAVRQQQVAGADTLSSTRAASHRSRLWALVSRQFAREGATLNPQISVQAVEHGLRVVARLDELGREERMRLRDRIAGLLSRHGFVAREIDVNARLPISEDK